MDKQQKILIVDDERLNINVLSDLLKPQYKIMAAINGAQALKAAHSASPPDLILLDIMMPEMDGYEVCRQLKEDDNTKDIPIIFVTAMGQESDETKGLELGAADYLTKPISPSIVQARVKSQLALKGSMEKLREAHDIIKVQKDRMEQELIVGRDIQLAMVPKLFPDSENYSIYASLEPAREVGGDFYDVFNVDEDHICFCIGDVSGKGVPAALFMAMAKTLIKSRASTDSSAASIVTHVNDELSEDNDGCLFVTLFVCILNIRTGVLMSTNAGHNPPYIKHSDNSLTTLSHRDGPAVAAIEGITYTEQTTQLSDGDTLLLFTDGVTEADDMDGTLFGEDRLENLFINWQSESMENLVKDVITATHEYEGENRQADDITVLGLNFIRQDIVDIANLQLVITNELSNIDSVNDQFEEFASGRDIPQKVISTINMVFDDLLTNIISYAYQDDEQHEIEIKIFLKKHSIVIVIIDAGLPFNPFHLDTPDTELSVEDRDIGGLGVHLVMNMMDNVSYQRKIDQNVVTLTKNLNI